MSGIAGIISLDSSLDSSSKDFEEFFKPLLVNKCTQHLIDKTDMYGFAGIGELEGLSLKYHYHVKLGVKVFIWGNPFLKEKQSDLSTPANIHLLAELWGKHSEAIVHHLTGFYNIFLYDEQANQFLLFNCMFGMMPLYYSIRNKTLFFSSRLQSFTSSRMFVTDLNRTVILQHLIFNYPVNQRSFINDVYVLSAACKISNSGANKWLIEKYDNHFNLLNEPEFNFNKGKDLIDQTLSKIIERFSSLTDQMGCAITGGWDGRLILSYLKKQRYNDPLLYTYGKIGHPDIDLALKFTAKFKFDHLPIFLGDDFIAQYERLGSEAIELSDGTRGANRGHYMKMARELSKRTTHVISGNCGSNILKIIQSSGPVYNEYVLRLFKTNNLAESVSKIYDDFYQRFTWIKPFVDKESFIDSVLESEIISDKSIKAGKRFYHYLLTNIERKYFGFEVASYASYIYNYTPFIDSEFIQAIVKTPYYGGHYEFLQNNPFIRVKLSKLYAHLMLANAPEFARFTSDRGFPITWFLNPFGRVTGFMVKQLRSRFFEGYIADPFNHNAGNSIIRKSWQLSDEFFNDPLNNHSSNTLHAALYFSHWYKHCFKQHE